MDVVINGEEFFYSPGDGKSWSYGCLWQNAWSLQAVVIERFSDTDSFLNWLKMKGGYVRKNGNHE